MRAYVFDSHMNNDMDMMDWGQYMWLYMLVGAILFLIFIIILLRILNHKSYQHERSTIFADKKDQKPIENKNIENKQQKIILCPNCKEEISDRNLKYCPYCGVQFS